MNPLVSVVMPVFNGEDTVLDTVRSVLQQTWRDLELIAVDDGSTDGSVAVLQQCVESDSRVRLLRNPSNLGIAAANNTGTAAARATWIAHIDDDDQWRPEKLERQMAFLSQHPEVGILGTWGTSMNRATGGVSHSKPPVTHDEIVERIWTGCPFIHSSIIVNRALLNRVGGYDPAFLFSEDLELYFRLVFETRAHNLPESLCIRQTHRPGNATMRHWKEIERNVFRIWLKYYRKHDRPWYTYARLARPLAKQLVPRTAKRWKQQLANLIGRTPRRAT